MEKRNYQNQLNGIDTSAKSPSENKVLQGGNGIERMGKHHLDKISGPLLDRIDLQIEVDSVPLQEMNDSVPSESSAVVAARVSRARNIQLERYNSIGKHCNAQLNNAEVKRFCTPDGEALRLLNTAVDSLHLSMRAYQRILKVSRTIADLEGKETISSNHVAEAVQYRELDQKYWR